MKRGQAMVELAIGSLVFVTVLLMGIHFGEQAIVTMKVKEAAFFAALDVTGHRANQFDPGALATGQTFRQFDPQSWGSVSQGRYRNLDGMSDRSGVGAYVQALTRAEPMRVSCRVDPTLRFGVEPAANPVRSGPNGQAFSWLRLRYRSAGGASCTASSSVSAFRVPVSFLEGSGGFFGAAHLGLVQIPSCGAGAPQSGACTGKLAVLAGDWALDGPMGDPLNDDVRSVEKNLVGNPGYRQMVQRLFELNGGNLSNSPTSPGRRLLRIGAGMNGSEPEWLDESRFNMSFKGDGPGSSVSIRRVDMRSPTTDGPSDLDYQTSGAHLRSSYVNWIPWNGDVIGVPRCFLGLRGCQADP